jgi:hypothetical protein
MATNGWVCYASAHAKREKRVPMSGSLEIDFVAYRGDPDDGAEAVSSRDLLKDGAEHDGIEWPGAYGAVVIDRDGERLLEPVPDPIFKLVSHLVRAVGSMFDSEPETVELTESEHGFLLEPSGEDVMISFFAGSAFDPDEYLLTEEHIPLDAFAEQLLGMGERLRDLIQRTDPDLFERDEYSQSLVEFLTMSRETFTHYKREKERGLR